MEAQHKALKEKKANSLNSVMTISLCIPAMYKSYLQRERMMVFVFFHRKQKEIENSLSVDHHFRERYRIF